MFIERTHKHTQPHNHTHTHTLTHIQLYPLSGFVLSSCHLYRIYMNYNRTRLQNEAMKVSSRWPTAPVAHCRQASLYAVCCREWWHLWPLA